MADPIPMTQEDLARLECRCGAEHQHELHLGPGCHVGAGLHSTYDKEEGVLYLYCRVCAKKVVGVLVAQRSVLLSDGVQEG